MAKPDAARNAGTRAAVTPDACRLRRLACIEEEWFGHQLEAMRARLQGEVRWMSALLPAVAAAEDKTVAELAEALRPGARSVGRLAARRPRYPEWISSTDPVDAWWLEGHFVSDAAIVRSAGPGKEGLGIRALCGCLDFALSVEDGMLATEAAVATLMIARVIPETLLSALRGEPVGRLVDHPLLRGDDLIVTSARMAAGGYAKITFHSGVMPLAMPWPDLGAAIANPGGSPR